MNRSVICYPQPGKAKSLTVLRSFALGCGGEIALTYTLGDAKARSPVAFFGLVGIEGLLKQAIGEGRTWFYGDNAYFDRCRERFFRFSVDAVQAIAPLSVPDYARLGRIGVEVKPWRKNGRKIVVVEQSEHFLKLTGSKDGWLLRVLADLRRYTDRPVIVRSWTRDKAKASASLRRDLDDAWAVVTHMSGAAVESLVYGVPVFVSGNGVATTLASGGLDRIESPRYPDGREDWVARLADSQWTLDELENGTAWRKLNG